MVRDLKYHGLQTEDPIKHITEFERICDLSKTNGVSEDAIKLRLFPFTLGDRARDWEQQIPPGTITTWTECKNAFLTKFFTNARTTRIRNQISGFTQNFNETLSQAWERFRSYIISCPHHDFKKSSLLGIFYKGALPNIQMFLDSSSGGSFLNKDIEFGWDLLENAAAADVTSGSDYDRNPRGLTVQESDIQRQMKSVTERLDKLNTLDAKIDKLLHGQSRKPVSAVYDEEFALEEELGQFEEVSYMQNQNSYKQNQGSYNNNQWRPNNNLSYRSNNVANPEDQVYPPNPQQQQQQPRPFIPRQQYNNNYRAAPQPPPGYQRPQVTQPFQPHQPAHQAPQQQQAQQTQQPPAQSPDINAMFQQLLQGQNDTNKNIAASHQDLNNKIEQLNARLTSVERNQASSSTRTTGQLPGKAVQNPKETTLEYNISSITLRSGKELSAYAKNDVVTEGSIVQVGGSQDEGKDQVPGEAEPKPHTTQTPAQPTPLPDKPQAPFPSRLKKGGAEKFKSLFRKQIQGIELKIPILDAFTLIPKYLNFMKDAVKDRERTLTGMSVDTHECKEVMQIRSKLEKLKDPGTFTLPCSVDGVTYNNCMCDLGASISLMPLSIARRLGSHKYKPCKISLVLADKSTRTAHGLLEDVPIVIGNAEVPTDFVVLDMGDQPENPLLLGRPFLASAGARIDVKYGKIELKLGKRNKMTFDINDGEKIPTIGGQTFSVEGLDQWQAKPLRHPRVLWVSGRKASDYQSKTPMYEEVVDGKSLESLFAGNKADNSPPEKLGKLPTLNLGPDIILKPLGYVNGAMEYKVRGTSRFKPFHKVRQLLSHSKPQPEMTGPFEVKAVLPCGSLTLVGKKGEAVPFDGQRVKLYLVAETEGTPPPLPAPPF